jgi:hypothetical protein
VTATTDNDVPGYAVSARHHDPLIPGTLVLAWPGSRDSSPLVTRTRGEVWTLGDGARVVAVEGYPGGISLDHVDVLPCITPPGSDQTPDPKGSV